MRKFLLVFLSIITALSSFAQLSDTDKNAAVRLVNAHQKDLALTNDDLKNFIVSNSYEDKTTGIRYVYLLQTYKGIIVNNQMQVLSFRNNKLLSKSGERIDYIDQKVDNNSGIPALSAQSAVTAAIADRKLTAKTGARALKSSADGQKIEFNDMGISRENITAQLMWVPDIKSKSVYLAWQVYIIPTTSADYWLVRVSATNGSTIEVDNMTDYDNWGPHSTGHESVKNEAGNISTSSTFNFFNLKNSEGSSNSQASSPSVVDGASYRVIPFPAESPLISAPALVTDPWTAAPGNATTLKWHTGLGGVEYTYTRGNNTWAYEDRTAPNGGDVSNSVQSTTPSSPLSFDFVPNFSVDPTQTTPVQNQQFNITNLFYWNNVIHDVMYQYGFTEAAANFQDDNMGRGGLGNDHVNGEAQDGSGTNNANFSTPADGSPARQQMYLWNINGSVPNKDGDVDNGIVIHEYGHGISNRLTGGGTASCLGNSEQMGEGWSDYYALMFTQNWAASNVNTGFTTQRGIGLYALNNGNLFPASPAGTGIRHYPYSTNMAINPLTYANLPVAVVPHGVGEIWCATLWDMTWNIIQQENSINANIYNVAGGGGNVIAMKLVTEGLKLQPCNPGFIDGRNAILQADINLYGGAHVCTIKEAFRRRGMGEGASQGASTSITDQTTSFESGAVTITLLQNNVTTTPEGQNITYTNYVTNQCDAVNNYKLTDTLPSNVTFVSATAGGSYDAVTRVVSWTVNLAAGSTQNYNFVVNINAGSYFPETNIINETVAGATIPASWTAASTTATQWTVSNAQSYSPPNSFFSADIAVVSDQTLTTTNSISLPANPPQLTFWHRYISESTFDGGVVEISLNGGTTWSDIGESNYVQNGYNSTISTQFSSPISGRRAFSGSVSNFIQSKINMTPYANQSDVKLRWRFASDASVSATGWYVDDIKIFNRANVFMRSNIYNALGELRVFADSVMQITAPECDPPAIGTVSISPALCPSTTGSIEVTATANGPMEFSVDNGTTWQSSNIFNGLSAGNYNVKVRLQNNPSCESTYALNPIEITVGSSINIVSINSNPATCTVSTGSINVIASSPNGTVVYSVDGTTWFPQGTSITGLTPGTYQVQLRLAEHTECVVNGGSVTVNAAPSLPQFNAISAGYPSCNNPTGGFGITSTSPDGPVELSIDGINWFPSPHVYSSVIPGTYTLQARLINSPACVSSTTLFMPSAPALPVFGSVTIIDANCTVQTGSITASASSAGEIVEVSVDGTTWYLSGTTISGLTPGSYTLTSRLQSSPTCIQAYATPVVISSISAAPATPGAVQGITNVCPYIGSDIVLTYSVPPVQGATSYTWTIPPTVTLVSGQGTNSITVMINANFLSNVNRLFRVTASNACGTSAERMYWLVAQLPGTPGAITGPVNACNLLGSSATYSIAPVASASSYIWTAQAGTTIVPAGAGVLGTSVTISFPVGFTTSAITVTAVNDCGTSGSRSINIVRTNPSTPGPISGPVNVCGNIGASGSVATYSVPVMANVSAYTWTVPPGVTDLAGQGSNTISFTYPAGFTNGTVSVTATNGCGISSARNLAVTKLNPATPSPIDVIQTQFCGAPGGRVFTYTLASLPANTASILWTVPTGSGAVIVSGQGSISITVSYPDASVTGVVTAQAIANCAVSTVRSTPVKLPACPPPAIAGTNKGNYRGTVEKNKAVSIAENSFDIVISPNPAITDFKVEVLTSGKEEVIITVIDNEGRLYKIFRTMPNQVIRFGSELKAGAYLVRVKQGNKEKTTKVIKF